MAKTKIWEIGPEFLALLKLKRVDFLRSIDGIFGDKVWFEC